MEELVVNVLVQGVGESVPVGGWRGGVTLRGGEVVLETGFQP